jgi:hypothetical protein
MIYLYRYLAEIEFWVVNLEPRQANLEPFIQWR